MRRTHVVKTAAFALAIVLVAHSVSHAQRGGFGGRGFGGGGALTVLRSEYIQDELNLTDDQKAKIREIAAESRGQAGRRGGRDLSPEERQKLVAEARERQQKIEQQVEQVLSDEQQKRLMGIQIQLAGPAAVLREDVAKEIELTDAQREKIREIVRSQRGQGRGQRAGLRGLSPEERREKLRDLAEQREAAQKELESKVNESLTKQQRDTLEQLKGDPIDRSKVFQRGGGRRRGRPNNS